MDFRRSGVTELADDVRAGRVSAVDVVRHAIERIETLNPSVNAFTAVDAERALAAAAGIDAAQVAGDELGPLAGIPIGVKDLEDAEGFVTSRGSAAFAGSGPARQDSVLVARLKAAGCIVVGKTNTPELGWQPDTLNPVFGATKNPWNLAHSPGGSSGGSAAAVASGMVPLATGSDGGGSIRIPSSLCGLSGMKPSLGRVPSGPEPPDWPDLSTKGPVARRIADVAAVLDVVIGPEQLDIRSLPMPEASWLATLDEPKVPRRVAWSPTLGYAPLDQEVRGICERAVAKIEELGADVVTVDDVFAADPVDQWLALASAYNWRTLAPFHGTDIWGKLDAGLAALAEWASGFGAQALLEAQALGDTLNARLVEVFHHARLLVTPTVATRCPRSGEVGTVDGRPEMNWVRFTYPFNMTRSPAATVTAGYDSAGMPVGLQLVGPQHADQVVLRSAAAIEAALGLDPVAPDIPIVA